MVRFSAPLDDVIDLQRLRERTSEKWRHYPQDVLPVFVAESDFPLAEPIARRLHRAIDLGDLGYAEPSELGEAYAHFARVRYGAEINARDVQAVPEVMIGVAEILRIVAQRGDRVAINSPVYPPFFQTIDEVRFAVEDVPLLRDGTRYALDIDGFERVLAAGVRIILLCNPHNPVGRVYTREELLPLAQLAKRYGALILADEIHGPLVLPGASFTPFSIIAQEMGVDAITLTSASKGWNIAGLKCALAVAHGDRARQIFAQLPSVMGERAGHLGVHATIAAFTEGIDYLDTVVAHLDVMRRQLRAIMDEAGLQKIAFAQPEGTYLAWFDCRELEIEDPATTFYKDGKVALYPGERFGGAYKQWVRFNYATSTAIVTDAAKRMASALNQR